MKIEEIISSLRDQIDDRESLIPPDDPDSIFKHDAEALREAVRLIEQIRSANAILQRVKKAAEQERDAAIRDLEKNHVLRREEHRHLQLLRNKDLLQQGRPPPMRPGLARQAERGGNRP